VVPDRCRRRPGPSRPGSETLIVAFRRFRSGGRGRGPRGGGCGRCGGGCGRCGGGRGPFGRRRRRVRARAGLVGVERPRRSL